MTLNLEQALDTLYQKAPGDFVEERKRLAGQLKSQGNKSAASQLMKAKRPTLSAWTVNQLWWQERERFEALLMSARRLRDGDMGATREHRELLRELRSAGLSLLEASNHAATESMLRRVTTTLSALALAGSFAPDRPGTLSADREPAGFAGALDESRLAELAQAEAQASVDEADSAASPESSEAAQQAAQEQEHEQAKAKAKAKAKAARERLKAALKLAHNELAADVTAIEELEAKLLERRRRMQAAQQRVQELEAELERSGE